MMDGLDAAKKENKKLKAVQSSTRKLMVDRMILTRQREMRWTALNVMKSMAENMPPELTVRSLTFNEMSNARGNKIALTGSVKSGDSTKAREFSEALLKAEVAELSAFLKTATASTRRMKTKEMKILDSRRLEDES